MSFLGTMPGIGMLDSFMHPERGYEEGEKALNQSWQEALGYMKPYNEAGTNEIPRLQGAAGNLLNPEELENKWSHGYEMSPYAKDELQRSQNYGLDAASAMGLSGSSAALENTQRTGSSIMNADRRNYLQDLIQKYLAGVQTSQNIFNTGAGIGQTMGQGALQTGENRAGFRYGQATAPGKLFGDIMGRAFTGGASGGFSGGGA